MVTQNGPIRFNEDSGEALAQWAGRGPDAATCLSRSDLASDHGQRAPVLAPRMIFEDNLASQPRPVVRHVLIVADLSWLDLRKLISYQLAAKPVWCVRALAAPVWRTCVSVCQRAAIVSARTS
jgi:hypothetical protein